MTKKILLLIHCFPPYTFPEAYVTAKRMGSIPGVEVDVLSIHPIFTWAKKDEDFYQYAQKKFNQIHHITLPKWYKSLPFKRLINFLSVPDGYKWLNYLYIKELHNLENYSAIVTCSMYHSAHLVGLKIKQQFPQLPWIAHFSDPWSTNPFAQKGKLYRSINKMLEKKVFHAADVLTFTSEETVKDCLADYSENICQKAVVIPHAFDEVLYKACTKLQAKQFTISYIGNFYGARQPDTFIQAMRILKEKFPCEMDNIKVQFIGSMKQTVALTSTEQTYINFIPSVDYISSLNKMVESDLLLVIDAPFATSPFLPSKLIDYIGANKPIFGVTPAGTSQKLIEEMGFLVAHPKNPQEIADKLLKMINLVRAGQFTSIPVQIRRRYSMPVIGQKMADIIHTITNSVTSN